MFSSYHFCLLVMNVLMYTQQILALLPCLFYAKGSSVVVQALGVAFTEEIVFGSSNKGQAPSRNPQKGLHGPEPPLNHLQNGDLHMKAVSKAAQRQDSFAATEQDPTKADPQQSEMGPKRQLCLHGLRSFRLLDHSAGEQLSKS